MPQRRCMQTRCRRSQSYKSCGEILPLASLRRGVRRVVSRCVRPVAFLPALDVNAGQNGGGVEVRKVP
jgi:hypothetical protein